METLSVNTPIKRPATPLDAGYCFCVYTLNRKCHYVTKYFNSTSKTTRPRGQARRGHNCHEAEASFLGLESEAGTDLASLINSVIRQVGYDVPSVLMRLRASAVAVSCWRDSSQTPSPREPIRPVGYTRSSLPASNEATQRCTKLSISRQ